MNALRSMQSRGFTLVELLTVVTIVAVLAVIAVPSYQSSIRKSRRTDGQIALNDLAQRLERCYTQFGAYDAADCVINAPYDSQESFYAVNLARTASTYALTATPQGPQASDSRCGALSLNHLGQRGAGGSHPEQCW